MLGTGVPRRARSGRRRGRLGRRRPAGPAAAGLAVTACVVAGGGLLAGCAQAASATTPIQVGTVAIPQPAAGGTTTDAYLVIQNHGPADRLISARTSEGGLVTFRGPARGGSGISMRTVPDIEIPARTTVRFVPNGFHLLITDARRLRGGTEITLRLDFARAGWIPVQAEITNPQTGGGSYF
jgi:periplasmic copper chaperone A